MNGDVFRALAAGIAAGAFSLSAATAFVVDDAAFSRLEAIPGVTASVTVPLVRDVAETAETQYLACAGKTNAVTWAAGQARAYPEVDTSSVSVCEDMPLTLLDETRAVVASSVIHGVADPGNSLRNPWWIGERTAEELNWGEWTMDLATAQAKVAAEGGDARVLVMVAGDLWCPHCQAMMSNCLERIEFTQWAEVNRIALVYLDQADGQVAYTNWETAIGSQLNWNADALPRAGRHGASGAGYLSRHGVSAAAAEAAYTRNLQLSMSDWLLPSSGGRRLSNPTFLLLMSDGTVAGRVLTYSDSDAYPVEENLVRFDAALALTDESATEAAWTTETHALGTSQTVSLQINAANRYLRLTDLQVGKAVVTCTRKTGTQQPVVTVWSGTASNLTKLASGAGSVELTVTAAHRAADDLWVSVSAFADASTVPYAARDPYFSGVLESEITALPGTVAFVQSAQTFFECAATGTIQVVRTGGSVGAVSVAVRHMGGTATNGVRYAWADQVVTWADGEDGVREIALDLFDDRVAEGRETFTLELSAEGDTPAERIGSPQVCTVTVDDSTLPELGQAVYNCDFYRGFSVEERQPIENITGDNPIRLRLLSGAFPRGVKAKYDRAARCFILRGVPQVSGTYRAEYAVAERRGGTYVFGPSSVFTIRVRNVTLSDEMGTSPVNAKAFSRLSGVSVPLYDEVLGSPRLAGFLKVSVSTAGKASVSYSGIRGKTTFGGRWSAYLPSTGAVSAEWTKNGSVCQLSMTPDARFEAIVTDARREGVVLSTRTAVGVLSDCSHYVGLYTVTLPAPSGLTGVSYSGTAWLTLEIRANGRVRFTGMAPNGKALGGTTGLVTDGDRAWVPVFETKSRGKTYLGASLAVLPDARDEYENGNPQIVTSESGVTASWSYDENGVTANRALEVYGGYYTPNFDLYACCEEKYDTTLFNVTFDLSALPSNLGVSAVAEAVVRVDESGIGIASCDSGFTLKTKPKTGVLSGKTKMVFGTGTRVSCTYKAATLPGWTDCGCTAEPPPERPLVSGTAYFTLLANGRRTRYSVPVNFIPVY